MIFEQSLYLLTLNSLAVVDLHRYHIILNKIIFYF